CLRLCATWSAVKPLSVVVGNSCVRSRSDRMKKVLSHQSLVLSQMKSPQSAALAADHGLRTKHQAPYLLFHDFLGLLIRHLSDLVLEFLQQGLHFVLALVALVLGHFLIFFRLVEVLVGVAAN